MININFAKKYVGEKILQETLNYLVKNPEQNIPKLAALLKKIVVNQNHKETIETILRG